MPSDQNLWRFYLEGDRHALSLLIGRYYNVLRRYGLKFMVHESVVEDCLQELFLQLWQNRERINDTVSVKHYLLKSVKHHILQHLRLTKNATAFEPGWDNTIASEADTEALMVREEALFQQMEQLNRQLSALPSREREALYLKYYENLTIPEIAEVMQVNKQSVSNFLQKALAKMRSRWLVTPVFVLLGLVP